ncbi:MAG: DUF2924 domain-containing protein [Rhodospirillales bacterium]|nr:DUF2924 domain-containing protein [Rhodospirillales bacterium]
MGLSRGFLELAAAYHAQAKVYGGLTKATQRKLIGIARNRRRQSMKRPPQATGSIGAGSRLVREWQGRCHTVEVTERGFLYAGRRYRSLSAAARSITGARWSGPRFFGL